MSKSGKPTGISNVGKSKMGPIPIQRSAPTGHLPRVTAKPVGASVATGHLPSGKPTGPKK